MNLKADPTGFGQFVPGFDFLQKLAQGGNAPLAGWVAPTLDPEALDKRIAELKAAQFWLEQNTVALKATLQALEVQKMTLATLKTMNVPMPGAGMGWPASATPQPVSAPGGRPKKTRAANTAAPPADPLQYWGALTRQFQQIADEALKDVAARSAAAGQATAKTTAVTDEPPARKTAPRPRKPRAS